MTKLTGRLGDAIHALRAARAAAADGQLEALPGLRALVERVPAPEGSDLVGDCWLWKGRVDKHGRGAGYARVGRAERAHLIVYTLLVGAVGRGKVLDHLCRRRHCVNPTHTAPVTQAENVRRLRLIYCKSGRHVLSGANVAPSGERKKDGTRGRCCRACKLERRRAKGY